MTNPMQTQVGGGHYRDLAIQPAEFWIRNQLPAGEGAVVKYLTRHRSKNGRQDVEKALHFVEMLRWWYFDAPDDQRAVPLHWRGQRNFVISAREYCERNRLPPEEAAAIALVCKCSCREHLDVALALVDQILGRDYVCPSPAPIAPALTDRDVLYMAKEQLDDFLGVLRASPATQGFIDSVQLTRDLVAERWRG
jgi:hypothetical protein